MASPIIWGPNSTANNLQQNLAFNNESGPSLLTGTVDPSSIATSANTGSLYMNQSSGVTYQKQDNGLTTNWTKLSTTVGTVTSVGLSVPGAIFSVSGTPVTSSGTLALSLLSQSANKVFASPDGSSGNPSFRSLVNADLPVMGSRVVTGSDNILSSDRNSVIYCNQTFVMILTLPVPTNGFNVFVKDISGTATTNKILVAPNSSEMIDGLANYALIASNYGSLRLTSDGTNWWIL